MKEWDFKIGGVPYDTIYNASKCNTEPQFNLTRNTKHPQLSWLESIILQNMPQNQISGTGGGSGVGSYSQYPDYVPNYKAQA